MPGLLHVQFELTLLENRPVKMKLIHLKLIIQVSLSLSNDIFV